ncbi:hypothetical protein GCM10010420_05400 [Streptomyces glaucosporus]|uniref:Uncharacterized protein n=1 Tax=Streptomyces glaucosporus TaxID=284044 RepID=A0ABN3HRD2_9ACTN
MGSVPRTVAPVLRHELDQWALIRTKTSYGPVYIHMGRKPLPDTDQFTYHPLYREGERPPD